MKRFDWDAVVDYALGKVTKLGPRPAARTLEVSVGTVERWRKLREPESGEKQTTGEPRDKVLEVLLRLHDEMEATNDNAPPENGEAKELQALGGERGVRALMRGYGSTEPAREAKWRMVEDIRRALARDPDGVPVWFVAMAAEMATEAVPLVTPPEDDLGARQIRAARAAKRGREGGS